MPADSEADVLVVGAGPTGLTLACELLRHGVRPRIIDKAAVPTDKSRAFGIHPRTLELLENMGIVDKFLEEGNVCNAFDMYEGTKPLLNLVFDNIDSSYPFVLMLPQSHTERILVAHLKSLGVEVDREVELRDIELGPERVTATLRDKYGAGERVRCKYLAGCDGAHSTTRHKLDFEFKGEPYPNYWLLADCKIDWKYPMFHLSVFIHPSGVTAYFPFREDRGRLMFELADAPIDEEITMPVLDDVHRRMEERGIGYNEISNPNWLAYFKLHHRIVDRYSDARVFLCGDSAHIHSPLGGQGMNTGMQDAYNLAWKLALVLKGKSPENLLDSYNAERHRVGAEVVAMTDKATRVATIHNPVLSAIRNRALGLLSRLNPVQEAVLSRLTQLEFHYRDSPIVDERWYESHEAEGYRPHGHELKAGERVRDYKLGGVNGATGTTLYKLFEGSEHELLIFTGASPEAMEIDELSQIASEISRYAGLVEPHLIIGTDSISAGFPEIKSSWMDCGLKMHTDFGAVRACLYLVRPDGYIAFRNQPASVSDLDQYLSTIFSV